MKLYVVALFFLLFCITGCNPEISPYGELVLAHSLIQPEDIRYDISLPDIHSEWDSAFNAHYFRPWHFDQDSLNSILASVPGPDSSFLSKYLADSEYYGENKRPHSDKRRQQLNANVNFDSFPRIMQRGITIRHTDIRRLPTIHPGYDRFTKAGEGFPFDYFQESALWANSPVMILHKTMDGAWAYVLASFYKGWVPDNDIALIDDAFIQQWERGKYCSILTDQIAVHTIEGRYIFNSKIGMLLPHIASGDTPGYRQVYAAVSDDVGRAVIKKCFLNEEKTAPKPLPFTGDHLYLLIKELHGNPYGWGGFWENRDCSSSIRDLYTPFGIWIPRNSSEQAHCGKTTFELPENSTEKMTLIKEKGIPFLTILYKKGHAMLYVGLSEQGEPLIFHTIWGLKSFYEDVDLESTLETYPLEGMHFNQDQGMFEGRKIIGQTAITTLTIGEEDPAIKYRIIDELTHMTVLIE